ncbi:MAG: NAD-dependent epimerase/dehydratase family protein [Mariprofundales bacterium]
MPTCSNALVVGASGFIGRYLCRFLQQRGVHVQAVARNHVNDDCWQHLHLLDISSDNQDKLATALSGVDTVFHLAGYANADDDDEQKHQLSHVEGTKKLLQAAEKAGVKRFVYFSSIKAMGNALDEEQKPEPNCAYGRAKLAAEQLVLQSTLDHCCILRPAIVYGAYAKGAINSMLSLTMRGLMPPLPATRKRRSLIHVHDLLRVTWLAALQAKANNQVYIVAAIESYSLRELHFAMLHILDKKNPHWHIPLSFFYLMAIIGESLAYLTKKNMPFNWRKLDILRCDACYSPAKLQRDFGFVSQISVVEGLRDMLDGLRKKTG